MAKNGGGYDDYDREREERRRLPDRELLERIGNDALYAVEAAGQLTREVATFKTEMREELADVKREVRDLRELVRPPPPPRLPPGVTHDRRRPRLESLATIEDDDNTGVRSLKGQLAEVAKRDAAERAVKASDMRRLRLLALVLGILVAAGTVAMGVWIIFRYAVTHA